MPKILAAPVLLAVVLLVAACGSGGGGSGASATASTGTQRAGAAGRGGFRSAAVQACLKKQGVQLPRRRPPVGEGGPPGAGSPPATGVPEAQRAKLRKALKACNVALRPRAGRPGGAPGVTSRAYRKAVESYVACVRRNGYDLPKPNLSGNGPVFDAAKVDRSDKSFQAASRRCQGLLRAGLRRPPPATTTTG